MAYTGNLVSQARYPTVELSAPLHPEHTAGAVPDDADVFGGHAPAGPGPDYGSPGLWVGAEESAPHTPGRPDPQSHTSPTAPRLTPPRLGWVAAQGVARDQMMAAHSARDSGTDASLPREPQFTFTGQRNIVNRVQGLGPWEPGMSGPLARGRNGYDQNNPPTVVYDGAGMRLGYDTVTWGEYRSPTVQAMRYRLRAVGREEVHFPVDTPAIEGARPGRGWGTGIQTAVSLPNKPRLFQAPGVSAMSDVTMAEDQADDGGGFASDGWG